MPGPDTTGRDAPLVRPPGEFVRPEFEADCARFLAQLRARLLATGRVRPKTG